MIALHHIPNWAWPSSAALADTGMVRLGRVIHWLLAKLAALCFLSGLSLTGISAIQNIEQGSAAQTWDKAHMWCVVGKNGRPLPDGPHCSTSYPYDLRDPRPLIQKTEIMPLAIASAVAFAFLMAGRAARYIASGE